MKSVGIKDVAREAGVSTTTVSLVLNDRAGSRISEATRAKVRDTAASIGYRPSAVARSLRLKRTQTIAVLSDRITTTPFAVAMLQAAQDVARQHSYVLLVVNTDLDREVEQDAIDALVSRQVDGMIYACMWHRVVEPPAGLPAGTVFLNGRPAGGGFPAVVPDDHGGAVAATRELIEQGHRRIGYIDTDEHPIPVAAELRREGFVSVLREHGIPPDPSLFASAPTTSTAGGLTAAGTLLDRPVHERPTALFGFNDRIAMGAYRAARHRGLEIPRDVSIVGYDDQQYIAADLDPPLTTVALPHYDMGRWAMEVLLGARPAPTNDDGVFRMPCPIVRRESVTPPPARSRA
jgi:DNA-binding LacI/PurR family transcriptional regulator